MATYTADQLINRALRLLGVLAEGETPSANESADALMALNQMLDSWSTERLAVFSSVEQVFTWPAGQVSRTLGPTGNLGPGARPVLLDDATYYKVGNISYPITIVNEAQYNSIPDKSLDSMLPQFAVVSALVPDVEIRLWPVPSQDIEMHFVSVAPLVEPPTLATTLTLPPGYIRTFVYNLAMELAPEFGVEPPNQVRRIATISKRNIKRINDPGDLLEVPIAGRLGFNIYSGE